MIDKELEQRLARIEETLRQIMPAVEDFNKVILESISALRAGYPGHTIVCCGSVAEHILKQVWMKEDIKGNPAEKTLDPLMQALKDNIEDRLIRDYLREIQIVRNRAAHRETRGRILEEDAVEVLRKLSIVINWYLTKYESPKQGDDSKQFPPPPVELKPPPEPVPPPPVELKPPSEPVPPPRIAPRPPAKPARPTLPAIENIHGWSAQQVQDLQQQTARALGLAIEFRDRLKDNSRGPLVVVIPGGRFLMGSPADEPGRSSNERQHEVEVTSFAIGKYAVTFEEYDRFAEVTQRNKPADEGWGRGRRPVINVTWFDAVAYAEWLSKQTDQQYRLPTEAEWEYACRAGTKTAYHFGAAINADLANYKSGGGFFKSLVAVFSRRTVEVGRYPANAWGLHDMHGNVWEWTCSVYGKDYGGGEQRCAAPDTGGPCVLRGGSWGDAPLWLRGAARGPGPPPLRYDYGGGFRLARTFSL